MWAKLGALEIAWNEAKEGKSHEAQGITSSPPSPHRWPLMMFVSLIWYD
jgi:hypothetical protein